ncbi:MAG: PilT/PilU family type 4a pilus ATPase [Verrucomicrobiota bacterium]|jgi:twitching motility protein PilT|nr:PilT/PilU family type 4a pilus ATPase [Verrucomicrobiota bacterium]MDQ3547106.1 PilT/PilU family type 4a pilus ATPase [Verrucomicrobiota bacterium]
MRTPDLDRILSAMLKTYDGISDLNFSVGHPLQVEDFGELKPVYVDPPIEHLTPYQTEHLALTLMNGDRHLMREYLRTGSCDCSYSLSDEARFRVNIFRQRGNFAIVMRKLQAEVPTIEGLELPSIFEEIAKEKTGLVLVTGATGSGKTTTLAAILNEVNLKQSVHVITLEDPIEFIHPPARATFSHRELGHDFDNYPNGLRAALRQAPKVILVGEMRDRATVEVALMAAETGHLVLSTLHTVDAGQAINRILGLFSLGEEQQLRLRLADSLRYVVSQRLAPRVSGGRHLLMEVMGHNLRTRETIALGEADNRSFYEITEASAPFGWITFDQSILRAYENGVISEETARLFSSKKGRVARGIDLIQKTRGIENQREAGLRLDRPVNAFR